uniref:(northern house mosquito) hypothetical protein n=1 Tax=Culex pipiens TaxID=7175 RepID=A0A8D8L613_CULPI
MEKPLPSNRSSNSSLFREIFACGDAVVREGLPESFGTSKLKSDSSSFEMLTSSGSSARTFSTFPSPSSNRMSLRNSSEHPCSIIKFISSRLSLRAFNPLPFDPTPSTLTPTESDLLLLSPFRDRLCVASVRNRSRTLFWCVTFPTRLEFVGDSSMTSIESSAFGLGCFTGVSA